MAAPEAPHHYQALYRRYRPQRFADVEGQGHVTEAMRNAVREGRVAQGYLFSGPRGTGKTTTARILAKALNCQETGDGEPCGRCASCEDIQQGSSFAVFELDAASNNGVDAIRDLTSRAALGAPGLRKVYILDEVHMLSTAASNTMLKTLEEPPPHVVFVLATTEPQKVLPTIKSRVQHFEFRLLATDVLRDLVAKVNDAAGLELSDRDLDHVVKRGAGSARDALSALDQAAALGTAVDQSNLAETIVEAVCGNDTGAALAALATGNREGRDPRRVAEETLGWLREAFLHTQAPELVSLTGEEAARAGDQARRLGPRRLVRALDVIGEALTQLRDALDPRVTLELAIVRLTRPEADGDPAALAERVAVLERRLAAMEDAAGSIAAAPSGRARSGGSAPSGPGRVAPPPGSPGAGGRGDAPTSPRPADAPTDPALPAADAPPAVAPAGELPTRDELTKAWGDAIIPAMRAGMKARFAAGRFIAVEDGAALLALPNEAHCRQCEPFRPDVEQLLQSHFGRRLPVRLVADPGPPEPRPSASDRGTPGPVAMPGPFDEEDASAGAHEPVTGRRGDEPPPPPSVTERLKAAFPGAQEVEG